MQLIGKTSLITYDMFTWTRATSFGNWNSSISDLHGWHHCCWELRQSCGQHNSKLKKNPVFFSRIPPISNPTFWPSNHYYLKKKKEKKEVFHLHYIFSQTPKESSMLNFVFMGEAWCWAEEIFPHSPKACQKQSALDLYQNNRTIEFSQTLHKDSKISRLNPF